MGNKEKIEALLFSSGKRMSIEELMKLCRLKEEDVLAGLHELKTDYDARGGSFRVLEEGRFWKLAVKEEFLPLVSKIIAETELPKTVLETLAVIAFRYPIKQSDLINIRTNKAYDHLMLLEDSGYITRTKYGRTRLIKLTQKFFEYFDLPPEKLKETFSSFEDIAKVIEQKEEDIKKIQEGQKKQAVDAGKKAQEEKEVDLLSDKGDPIKLETYADESKKFEHEEQEIPKEDEESFKEVEVYESEEEKPDVIEEEKEDVSEGKSEERSEAEPSEEMNDDHDSQDEEKNKEDTEAEQDHEESKDSEEKKETSDDEVDKRVEEILHPKEKKEKNEDDDHASS